MADPCPGQSGLCAPVLSGIRVVEFCGIGPVPHAAMLLGDMGAEIVRIDRPEPAQHTDPVTNRGRTSLPLDLKSQQGRDSAAAAIACADIVIEGFRPGVMERLGLGPEPMLARNARLIYGRMTGWGQDGPLAPRVGHDINYIAIAGALDEIGMADRPPLPPLNLVGDFGGGSLYLVIGILLALVERGNSGKGQVVDAAIVDGTASLLAGLAGMRELIGAGRGRNSLGGASPSYRTYRCADGGHIAVGALEEVFWNRLADALGLSAQERRRDGADAAALHHRLEQVFSQATAEQWIDRLGSLDCCVTPVLSLEQAALHPHLVARGTYVERAGRHHPAPAPRLSRTPGAIGRPAPEWGEGGAEMLERWQAAVGRPAEPLEPGMRCHD